MADTSRTKSDLLNNIFPDNQAAGSITAQDMRDLIESVADQPTLNPVTVAAQLKSNVTQPAAGVNTDTVVALEVNSYVENITHSVSVNNSEITLDLPGVYEITVNLSVWDDGGGGGIFTARLQEDIGAGWVETDAAVRRDGSNNAAGFASFMHMDRHAAGDKYRVVFIADTTNISLEAFTPGVGTHPASHPAVPSVDFHVKRVGL